MINWNLEAVSTLKQEEPRDLIKGLYKYCIFQLVRTGADAVVLEEKLKEADQDLVLEAITELKAEGKIREK